MADGIQVRFLSPDERRLALVICSFCGKERRGRYELMRAERSGEHTICVYCAMDAAHGFSVARGDK